MSNDLISRSALLEELKEKVYPEKFGERCNAIDVIYAVLQVIEEQPTAYDVDKVVEQLETKILGKVCIECGYLKDNVCTYKGANCGVSKPIYENIKKVFEEVKAGGVNE